MEQATQKLQFLKRRGQRAGVEQERMLRRSGGFAQTGPAGCGVAESEGEVKGWQANSPAAGRATCPRNDIGTAR